MQFLRWWRTSDRDLSSEARSMLRALNELADERDRLNRDLTHAVDTIRTLQDQLAEYDFLLRQAQSRLARQELSSSGPTDSRSSRGRQSTAATTATSSSSGSSGSSQAWIQGTWLCSSQNSELLGTAENEWKHGNPQRAVNTLSLTLSTHKNLALSEKLKVRLLMAAIFHCYGNHEDSNQLLDTVIEKTQDRLIPNYSHTMELAGIARFIHGKNLIAQGNWNEAFWSLTKALYTPGYHDKAQRLQDEALRTLESTSAGDTWIPTIRTLSRYFSGT